MTVLVKKNGVVISMMTFKTPMPALAADSHGCVQRTNSERLAADRGYDKTGAGVRRSQNLSQQVGEEDAMIY